MKRPVLFLLFCLLSLSFLKAQCTSGNCWDGSGIYLFPSGAKYIGEFDKGRIQGFGTCFYSDGSKYQGDWQDGYPNGQGTKSYPDGRELRGRWEKGKFMDRNKVTTASQIPVDYSSSVSEEEKEAGCVSGDCENGHGIYIYPSGAMYVGEFKDGEIHGVGVCNYSDGSKYQGEWIHRFPSGKGTKVYPDGTSRNGFWKRGQPVDENGLILEHLAGTEDLIDAGTDIQTGCINGDCENGYGTKTYVDGSKYVGDFRNGKQDGQGVFYQADGDRYEGSFTGGYRNGYGKVFKADNSIITGRWDMGEFIGRPSTKRVNICLEGDCENGYGIYRFADGSEYTGTFHFGNPDGEGTMSYPDGRSYSGGWLKSDYHGKGTLINEDGSEIMGFWEYGTYMGRERRQNRVYASRPSAAKKKQLPKLKVWAIVVGVAAYNHMPVLRYTDDDAYRMYAFLKSPEGGALQDDQIRILIDEDATRSNIKHTMRELFGKAGPNDLVLLYFSGHGLKGSFLPYDYDGYENKLLHTEINSILKSSPAKYKFCIADACHSGSLLAMRGGGEVSNTLSNYYDNLAKAAPGTALIMSSKSDETSLESSGLRQGVFSHFLIRGLKGEADTDMDKVVNVSELFSYISENVRNYTKYRQSPVIQGTYDPKMSVAVVR